MEVPFCIADNVELEVINEIMLAILEEKSGAESDSGEEMSGEGEEVNYLSYVRWAS